MGRMIVRWMLLSNERSESGKEEIAEFERTERDSMLLVMSSVTGLEDWMDW